MTAIILACTSIVAVILLFAYRVMQYPKIKEFHDDGKYRMWCDEDPRKQ